MAAGSATATMFDARLSPVWRVELVTHASAQNQPQSAANENLSGQQQEAATIAALTPADLLIEIDRVSGRFINTLMDPHSKEVIRRYPSEGQLAFSRAVSAYMRALREG